MGADNACGLDGNIARERLAEFLSDGELLRRDVWNMPRRGCETGGKLKKIMGSSDLSLYVDKLKLMC
jgi:hypothetical protein